MIPKILAKIFSFLYGYGPIRARLTADDYGHLYTRDSELYMARYAVIRVGTKASKVLSLLTGGRYDHVRLHVISKPDADRELHNHPFTYRTFVLQGMYVEQLDPAGFRLLGKGSTAATKDGHFHRIAYIPSKQVHTLFVMGKDTGEWGFLVDGKFMPSKEFFKQRRIAADGKAE